MALKTVFTTKHIKHTKHTIKSRLKERQKTNSLRLFYFRLLLSCGFACPTIALATADGRKGFAKYPENPVNAPEYPIADRKNPSSLLYQKEKRRFVILKGSNENRKYLSNVKGRPRFFISV